MFSNIFEIDPAAKAAQSDTGRVKVLNPKPQPLDAGSNRGSHG